MHAGFEAAAADAADAAAGCWLLLGVFYAAGRMAEHRFRISFIEH